MLALLQVALYHLVLPFQDLELGLKCADHLDITSFKRLLFLQQGVFLRLGGLHIRLKLPVLLLELALLRIELGHHLFFHASHHGRAIPDLPLHLFFSLHELCDLLLLLCLALLFDRVDALPARPSGTTCPRCPCLRRACPGWCDGVVLSGACRLQEGRGQVAPLGLGLGHCWLRLGCGC